jgi:hypothetical protein
MKKSKQKDSLLGNGSEGEVEVASKAPSPSFSTLHSTLYNNTKTAQIDNEKRDFDDEDNDTKDVFTPGNNFMMDCLCGLFQVLFVDDSK